MSTAVMHEETPTLATYLEQAAVPNVFSGPLPIEKSIPPTPVRMICLLWQVSRFDRQPLI